MTKRFFDILIILLFAPIWLPAILIIGIIVRYAVGAPVFFCQARSGLHGKPFEIVKFRTMTDERDETGIFLPDAERLTRFGDFLRSISLDELPELWNVLKGEMSLVGPRPLLIEYLPLYNKYQARRHEVRPGITGWAQVNGRNALDWDERFKLDVWYVDNRSLLLDLKILWQTVVTVLSRRGIRHPGHATMRKFTGGKTEK